MKCCIIGCGAMGSSLARGLAEAHEVNLFDKDTDKAKKLADNINGNSFSKLQQAISGAELIIVAVKPKDLEEAAGHLSEHATQDQIVISVAGGVATLQLEKLFGQLLFVRAMPNIACAYGKGVVGLVKTDNISSEISEKVEKALTPLGFVLWLNEEQLEGLTALAGCGPAFAFVIVESMIDAGIAMGLTADISKKLTLETWEGALTLLKKSGKTPGELKWQVASPGGITIAGLQEMEDSAVRAGIINTIMAAYEKSIENL